MTSATSPDPRALMSCPEESSDNFGGITWNPHDEFREKKNKISNAQVITHFDGYKPSITMAGL